MIMRMHKTLNLITPVTAMILALTACGVGQRALVQPESAPVSKSSFAQAHDIVRSAAAESLPAQSPGADRMDSD